jgi:pyridinium-3,5-biscarboxylic acid mononucleotide synthase
MMDLLKRFKRGEIGEEEVVREMVRQPFEEALIGRFDTHREARTGIPEAILAEGKRPEAVAELFARHVERGEQLIATRVTPPILEALEPLRARLCVYEEARIVAVRERAPEVDRPTVLVISAGTLDRPVAEECAVTSALLGNPTSRLYDVGVAGLGRLVSELGRLDEAGILIVVAGMDGALPSVVGGLARQVVISVPTSVGYGAAFGGVAPLLTMLNSCAPGNAVVNIDNGFGAAVLATKINLLIVRARSQDEAR